MTASTPFEAVILAGGLGTRLRSVLPGKPKVMAEVGGAPFVSWIMKSLKRDGITRVILSVGYLSSQVEEYFKDSFDGLEIVYSKEETPRGTGGGVALASRFLTGDSAFVLNGDSWCVTNLRDYIQWHIAKKAEASLVMARVENSDRYGSVLCDSNQQIESFLEKNASNTSSWINAGIYLASKSKLQSIPVHEEPISLERDVLPKWVQSGMFGYQSNGSFIDIGTPESFQLAEQFVKNFK